MTHDESLWTYENQRQSEELWHSKIREIRATLQAIAQQTTPQGDK